MTETIYEIGERLCRTYNRQHQSGDCSGCPLAGEHENMECLAATISCLNIKNVEKQLELRRKWAEEHPVKTYKDVLLERLPSVAMLEDDVPCICRNSAFGIGEVCLDILLGTQKCKACWNEPYKEQENDA